MTAIWTLPRTWATGEIVTAAMLNQYLRDELDYLKARPVARVSDLDGTVLSTTSATFVDITGATVNITTSGSSRLLILASGSATFPNANVSYVTALVDGTNQGDSSLGMVSGTFATTPVPWSLVFLTSAAVADGAHTVKLQARITAGGTLVISQFSLTVLEVF
jgi:hypothetical protein